MRVVVTGRQGQLARALAEVGAKKGVDAVLVGRPELDLERPESIAPALAALAPDIIVNAAAYTAVDHAESEPERALAINAGGARAVAEAAKRFEVPLIHISTDYVFDGSAARPYEEDDPPRPIGAYGSSKLEGEKAVRETLSDSVVLRTAWLYSPFGGNFVRTMLRLAATKDEIAVVDDQIGSPTSAENLADSVFAIARNLLADRKNLSLRGVFHAADKGEASWAELANAVFTCSRAFKGPYARVRAIPSSQYLRDAKRPANSRLATAKLRRVHGIEPRPWREAVERCVLRLLEADVASGRNP
jgi:dTDP-4-dehydrorhamnose reductase